TLRLAGRPRVVPLVAEPARLARPGTHGADAAVPGQRLAPQAALRTAARRGGSRPGCPAPAAGRAAHRRLTHRGQPPSTLAPTVPVPAASLPPGWTPSRDAAPAQSPADPVRQRGRTEAPARATISCSAATCRSN